MKQKALKLVSSFIFRFLEIEMPQPGVIPSQIGQMVRGFER
jgi:hypothetical protein